MLAFKTFLSQHLNIGLEDWEIIRSKLRERDAKKAEILTAHGQVEKNLYFVMDGILRLFYEADNKDITLNFAFPNSFISCYSSFLTTDKTDFNLQALTDCKLAYLTKEDLEYLYLHTTCGQELGRILAEKLFLYLSERENAFLLKSPTQRYLDLFEEQARLIQEIPQKYLASYIGITPQALSRIRAKI